MKLLLFLCIIITDILRGWIILLKLLKYVFLFSFCTNLIILAPPTLANSPERWILNFKSTVKTGDAAGQVKYLWTVTGKVNLNISQNNILSGTGDMSVTYLITAPMMTGTAKGSGAFTITGKRDGEFLYFQFKGSDIPVKGSIKILGKSEPWNDTFSPSLIAPVDMTILRKEGATSPQQHSIGLFQINNVFTLSGGINLKADTLPITGTFPEKENIWILEMDGEWTMNIPKMGKVKVTIKGDAKFPLPIDDGPAIGEGNFTLRMNPNLENIDGKYILKGNIKAGVLNFKPKVTLDKGTAKALTGTVKMDYGEGIWSQSDEPIQLPVENGAELTIPINVPQAYSFGEITYRLKGKKIEYWQITIDDYTKACIIDVSGNKGKRGGLDVHTSRKIEVVIEDNKFKQGTGTSSFVALDPYSYPPWAYTCYSTDLIIFGSGTAVEAERYDQVRNAAKFNPPKNKKDADLKKKWDAIKKRKTPYIFPDAFSLGGDKQGYELSLFLPVPCGYTVGITCTLNEKEIISKGYKISPGTAKKRSDTERREYLTRYKVTLVDGWTHSDAPSNAEDRTVIKVKKLKK